MSNNDDDFLLSLDLDSLLNSTPTLTENTSIIKNVVQNVGLPESSEQVSAQNDINAESNYYKAKYLKEQKDFAKLKANTKILEAQYARVLKEYTEIQREKQATNAKYKESRKECEQLTQEKENLQRDKNALDNQYSMLYTMHEASWSKIKQLTHLVDNLKSENANYKISEEARKTMARKYSSLEKKYKVCEKKLSSLTAKLDSPTDIKNCDPETTRQIKKYTNNKNADLESIDSESVDTGRGSSFSFYSPAYSINYSPLDRTENCALKIMKDVSTSTQQTNETFNLSGLSITSPSLDVGTKLLASSLTTDITKPLEPTPVTSPVAQTLEISTPFKPAAVTRPVAKTPEMTWPLQPADVVAWPTVKIPEITYQLKPIDVPKHADLLTGPNDTNVKGQSLTKKVSDMTRLFKPVAVSSPVAPTLEITRLFQPADVAEWSTDKPLEMNRSLDTTVGPRPTVKIPEITMQLKSTAVPKHADLLTGPNDTNDTSLTTKVSEMARPFKTTDFVDQEAKNTTSEHVISLVNNKISVISKTPDWTKPHNAANMRSSVIQSPSSSAAARKPLIKTKTPDKTNQNENIKIFPSENSLTKVFIENDETQDEMDEELEITMILNKFTIDWNALSPMSITPDLDEEGLDHSKSDVRNDETERQSSAHSRPQMCEESDALFVITPDYKKLTIPQNQSNTLKPELNEDKPSHLNKNKVPKSHTIPPVTNTPVYNENERQSNKTINLSEQAPVKICEEKQKSNNKIEIEQSISLLASNISSLESQSDLHNIQYAESNSLSQPSRIQLTQSQQQMESIVSKSPESIKAIIPSAQSKRKSETETETKLQSSPIDNMSISKEPQSHTPKPPERRRSERIKTMISAAQSKTKLQSCPIDNTSISKEPKSVVHTSPKERRSEVIKVTTPSAQSKTKRLLSPIDNTSISKESQSIVHTSPKGRRSEMIKATTPSAQSKTKRLMSPIDNISISKEQQSILCTPPERRRSERIKSLTPTTQSKTKSVPQTRTKLQSCPIDNVPIKQESQSNLCTPPQRRRSERIKSLTPTAQSKTILQSCPIDNVSIKKEPQCIWCTPPKRRRSEKLKSPKAQSKTKRLFSPIDNNSISKENQSIMHISPERTRSECIKSTTPSTQSEKNSVPQAQIKLQLSTIDNMSIKKEPQSNMPKLTERSDRIKSTNPAAQSKTESVSQTQSILQSNLINKISLLKESQYIMCTPPKERRSDLIKSTTPSTLSERNSVPQTQMKLPPSLIDKESISKEPQSNTRSGCASIISNPEYGRKRTICRSTETQLNNIHNKRQKSSECDTSKHHSSEICSEDIFTNSCSKPPIKRISRVKESVSTNTKISNNKDSKNITDRKVTETMNIYKTNNKDLTQSDMKSLPQTQMKLQPSLIDKESISKEPQSNTRSGCASIISNPEYGRKRTTCRSTETQLNNIHTKRQKSSECDTSKLNSPEICSEDIFTNSYSKPPIKRISRVKESVSTNTKISNNKDSKNITERKVTETMNIYKTNNKDLTYSPPSNRAKLAHEKTGRNEDNIEMSITHASTKNNSPDANLKSTSSAVQAWTTHKKNNPMTISEQFQNECRRDLPDYNDIDIFDTDLNNLKTHLNDTHNKSDEMVVRYGSNRKNINITKYRGKYENQIDIKIEKAVAVCISSARNKYTKSLAEAVDELKKHSLSQLASGFYKYLNKMDRKKEFVPEYKNRNYSLKPTPTNYVKSLMDIIDMIDRNGLKLWERVLDTCRYMLFRLNEGATKRFDIVESVTHLFVHMCQYEGRRNSKLVVLFMLAAMYCANYRALIIVKTCLDLVPKILPHECQKEKTLDNGINPLIQIFVFLLHFYKCKDEHKKVQHLRFTLKKRYGYDPTQENLQTILSKVKQTVLKINDHYLDNSMLQYSILLLAKRNGTEWCQKNIVKNIILPILGGKIYASKAAFQFCATIITKLLKPYTKEMKIHSEEIVKVLLDIIEQPHPQEMKDEIMCGLLCLNMENVKLHLNRFLKIWDPPSKSPQLSKALNKFFKKQING